MSKTDFVTKCTIVINYGTSNRKRFEKSAFFGNQNQSSFWSKSGFDTIEKRSPEYQIILTYNIKHLVLLSAKKKYKFFSKLSSPEHH